MYDLVKIVNGQKCLIIFALYDRFELDQLQSLDDDVENFLVITRKSTATIHYGVAHSHLARDRI